MAAVSETGNALKALDEGKKDDALADLEKTTGKLELILARDPQLTLAPT
ncbi:YfdX family protein, partial [Vibrio parahaemolyticus]